MHKSLRICLYSPYVPGHFGGGERYFFSVATYLAKQHDVVVAVGNHEIHEASLQADYEAFFQLPMQRIHFVNSPLGNPRANFITKTLWTRQFDVMFYVTDGSVFRSRAKRNIMHIQFPFNYFPRRNPIARLKLRSWHILNSNSEFTKAVIDRSWPKKVDVVHTPFVDSTIYRPAHKKANIILNVGRFFRHTHSKRQDVMVKAFKQLVDEHPEKLKSWKLVLIGGVEDKEYFNQIKKAADGYPITILPNADVEALRSYYSLSKIYWHATGYEVDEFVQPMHVEHFGISTLEAMASEAVPVVIRKGGQKEIVQHGVTGFLWNELDAMKEKTLWCIENEEEAEKIGKAAREHVIATYNPTKFYQQLEEMIGSEKQVSAPLKDPRVSAVIPTFNARKILEKNLPEVLATLRAGDELVVVDDHSPDDTVEWMTKEFKLEKVEDRAEFDNELFDGVYKEGKSGREKEITIKLLANKKNLRFAKACNIGVKVAEGELILLLNNDVVPDHNILDHLLPHFLAHGGLTQEVFAVGCMEKEPAHEGKPEHTGGKNELWFERGLFRHRRARQFDKGETAWVSGGSGLYDRAKWLELGGFDPRYAPAYWEDIDLSARARKHGWLIYFEPDAVVSHRHETTNAQVFGNNSIEVMSVKNSLLFTWTHSSLKQKLQMLAWMPYHILKTNRALKGSFLKGLNQWLGQSLSSNR